MMIFYEGKSFFIPSFCYLNIVGGSARFCVTGLGQRQMSAKKLHTEAKAKIVELDQRFFTPLKLQFWGLPPPNVSKFCIKFGHLISRKNIKLVATRCQIWPLQTPLGELTALPKPPLWGLLLREGWGRYEEWQEESEGKGVIMRRSGERGGREGE